MKNSSTKVHPFVSVIIPVFNDPIRLQLCLQALQKQTYPQECYEVIVVDNGSSEPLSSIVANYSQVRLAYEKQPSSYAARNKGISLGRGDILAFTDADCIPNCDWLERGVESLQNVPDCGFVAGRVDIFFKNPASPTAVELYNKIKEFDQKHYVENLNFGVTANLFILKNVFDQIGPFNSQLKSWGDIEWCLRVHAAGYAIRYASDVCVKHPARRTLIQLYKKTTRIVGGARELYAKNSRSFLGINRSVLKNLIPPIQSAKSAFMDSRLIGIKQKIKVVFIVFFVRYVTAIEIIRLNLGGVSRRE